MSDLDSGLKELLLNIIQVLLTYHSLSQWSSTGVDFAPKGTFDHVWRHFCLTQLEMEVATGIWCIGRPGMLLNNAQDSHHNRELSVLTVQRLRNPASS